MVHAKLWMCVCGIASKVMVKRGARQGKRPRGKGCGEKRPGIGALCPSCRKVTH
jgi:hypothetical protein